MSGMKFESKMIGGHVVEHKEIERDGVRLGVIEALIATWEPDTGGIFGVPDQFVPGAFAESLMEHRARGNRQVRLKEQHGIVIGGFPIEMVRETSAGLFGVGEINLDIPEGRRVWALIKQGVLVDMSVGFSALEDTIERGLRIISKAILWEGSVVDEPANRGAGILSFKATPFADLPVADKGHTWDPVAARRRVEELAASQQIELKAAFAREEDGIPALQIADVVDGSLVVVPDAVLDAAKRLVGTEGAEPVIEHLERYLAKMGAPSPFPIEQRRFFGATEAREMKAADLERALTTGAVFSAKAAKAMAARLTAQEEGGYDRGSIERILRNLEDAKRELSR